MWAGTAYPWRRVRPVGAEENTRNPVFVGSGYYHLSVGSQCIDTGAIIAAIDFIGTAPDRGAFESTAVFSTDKIGDLLYKEDSEPVSLTTSLVTAGNGIFDGNIIYVEDELRAAGIRVQTSSEALPVDEGSRVKVDGTMSTQNNMRTIIASNVEYITGDDPLTPLGMNGKSLDQGLAVRGLLVKAWSKVIRIAGVTTYFCLDDGVPARLMVWDTPACLSNCANSVDTPDSIRRCTKLSDAGYSPDDWANTLNNKGQYRILTKYIIRHNNAINCTSVDGHSSLVRSGTFTSAMFSKTRK